MNIPGNILNTLTDEQKRKIEAAQTPEELLAIAKETGYELSQEQLDSVAGGDHSNWCGEDCPYCVHGPCKEECVIYGTCTEYCIKYSK